MPIKMVRVGDLYGASEAQNLLKVLIAGPPGAGKTRLAASFPNPIWLDMEGRLLSIRERVDIPVFQIHTIGELEEVYAMVHQEPRVRRSLLNGYEVKTLVLDTVDEMAKILMKERLNSEKAETPTFKDWGYFADKGRSILRGFRNLDLNVVINCHVRETSDNETGRSEKRPDISGSLGNELAAYFDECWLLRSRSVLDPTTGDRTLQRFLQTVPDLQYEWLKDHSGVMPAEFPVNLTNDYARIAKLIFPAIAKPQAEAKPEENPDNNVAVEPKARTNGKAVPENPVRKARGRAAKADVIDVPLPEGDPAPTSLTVTESAEDRSVTAPVATATITTTEPPQAPPPEPEVPPVPEPEPEPEPETETEPVSTVGTESPVSEAKGPLCATCGEIIENPDIAELSEIRFGEQLCPTHFKARRDAK